jgi:hypothetical protein
MFLLLPLLSLVTVTTAAGASLARFSCRSPSKGVLALGTRFLLAWRVSVGVLGTGVVGALLLEPRLESSS